MLDAERTVKILESKGMTETRDLDLPDGTFYINRVFNAVSLRVNRIDVDLTFIDGFDPVKWFQNGDINLNGLVFDNRNNQLHNKDVSFDIANKKLTFCDPENAHLDPLKIVNALKQMTKIEELRVSADSLDVIRSNIPVLYEYFQANPYMLYKLYSLRGNPYTSEVTAFILGCNGGSNLVDLLSGIN